MSVNPQLHPCANLECLALELVAKDPRTSNELIAVRDVLTDARCNLGELLEQAIRHRLLWRIGAIVSSNEWGRLLPHAIHFHLAEAHRINRHRTLVLREAAASLVSEFSRRHIRVAITKGVILEASVYRGDGTRRFNDIDFMISPRDRNAVKNALIESGFAMGTYNWSTGTIDHLDRRTMVKYAMQPDHLPHFVRVISDPVVPYIMVDIANSFTWDGSEWQVPIDDALSNIEWMDIGERMLPTMPWCELFLFTILHFFREAWFANNIGNDDVTLAKFADVFVTWKYHRDEILAGGLRTLATRYSLQKPIAWVGGHVDAVLGSDIVRQTGCEGYADPAWLNCLCGSDRQILTCAMTMRERLYSKRSLAVD